MQAPVRKKKGRVEEGRVYEIQEEWKQEEKEGIGNKPKETKASKSTNKAEEKAGTGPPAPWGPQYRTSLAPWARRSGGEP